MSLQFKLIIPLLDENITLEDLSLTSGFMDAYTEDVNHPYMDNHIFLLYSNEVITKESIECQRKLSKLPTLYSRRNLKINGHSYCSFAFAICNKTIRQLKSQIGYLTDDEKCRINKFWHGTDDEVSKYLMNEDNFLRFESVSHVIPEEDYVPLSRFDNEKTGLSIKDGPVSFLL